jgi:hypothetical protein
VRLLRQEQALLRPELSSYVPTALQFPAEGQETEWIATYWLAAASAFAGRTASIPSHRVFVVVVDPDVAAAPPASSSRQMPANATIVARLIRIPEPQPPP